MGAGAKFPTILFVSSDGVRLRAVYNTPVLAVATIYLKDPSPSYAVGDVVERGLDFQVNGVSKVLQIDHVTVKGQADEAMLRSSSSYAHARLGEEIAYAVSKQNLGLNDVVLQDPAWGGADLFTKDGKVVIEARMLTDTDGAPLSQVSSEIQDQLAKLVGRLNSDFDYYKSAGTGYGILSYLDSQGSIRTIVIEVLKS